MRETFEAAGQVAVTATVLADARAGRPPGGALRALGCDLTLGVVRDPDRVVVPVGVAGMTRGAVTGALAEAAPSLVDGLVSGRGSAGTLLLWSVSGGEVTVLDGHDPAQGRAKPGAAPPQP